MSTFKCKKCGGTIQIKPGDTFGVCDTCGMKQTLSELDSDNKANPLLRRVFMFLEDGDWKRADEYCEKVLDLDPENAEAYLGKLMAELRVRTREALKDQPEPFDNLSNYQKVLRFGDEKLKQQLAADAAFIKDRYETAREEARIAEEKAAKKRKRTIAIVMPAVFICIACIAFVIVLIKVIIPTKKYNAAIDLYYAGRYEDAIASFTAMDGYKDSAAQIERCKTAIKDNKYAAAVELYTAGKYADAIAAFTALDGYKDSAAKITGIYKQLLSNASIGTTIFFGSYEQDKNSSNGKEDIEWIVLAREDERILVISRYALDWQQYNKSYASVTWETCSLRKWLNGTFLNDAFSEIERAMIPSVLVGPGNNPSYSTSPGNITADQLFLLSITEANKYFSTDSARQCQETVYRYTQGAYEANNGYFWWWLRSPGYDSYNAALVYRDGSVYDHGDGVNRPNGAVRPAMWIDLG